MGCNCSPHRIPEIVPLFIEEDTFPVLVSPEDAIPIPFNGDSALFRQRWNSKGKDIVPSSSLVLDRGCSPVIVPEAGSWAPAMAVQRVVSDGKGGESLEKVSSRDMVAAQMGPIRVRSVGVSEFGRGPSHFVGPLLVSNEVVGGVLGLFSFNFSLDRLCFGPSTSILSEDDEVEEWYDVGGPILSEERPKSITLTLLEPSPGVEETEALSHFPLGEESGISTSSSESGGCHRGHKLVLNYSERKIK
ncbi:hypothetical protein LINGRAHAP2_LOCUS31615 [Linum grandiflorum]